jgi:hypothetical protein
LRNVIQLLTRIVDEGDRIQTKTIYVIANKLDFLGKRSVAFPIEDTRGLLFDQGFSRTLRTSFLLFVISDKIKEAALFLFYIYWDCLPDY